LIYDSIKEKEPIRSHDRNRRDDGIHDFSTQKYRIDVGMTISGYDGKMKTELKAFSYHRIGVNPHLSISYDSLTKKD
jgi:hypothetical protein